MLCAFCELKAAKGVLLVDGKILCEDCAALELLECRDCGHLVDARDKHTIHTDAGICPECESVESFAVLEVE